MRATQLLFALGAAYAPDYGAFVPQEESDPAVVPSSIKKTSSSMGASLHAPAGVAVADGTVYVADTDGHAVRSVNGGSSKAVAGNAEERGFADGSADGARFFSPAGIAALGGDLVIADTSNHALRHVSASGAVMTLWRGKGTAAAEARDAGEDYVQKKHGWPKVPVRGVWNPQGLTPYGANGVLVADTDNHRLLRFAPGPGGAWQLSRFAGSGLRGAADGPVEFASFRYPRGVAACTAADGSTQVFVADSGNSNVRRIRYVTPESGGPAEWVVDTLAGIGAPGFADTMIKREKPKASVLVESRLPAEFAMPEGVACAGAGGVVVADTYNHRLRHVAADGLTITLSDSLEEPRGVAVDGESDTKFYVADSGHSKVRVLEVSSFGELDVIGSAAPLTAVRAVGRAVLVATLVSLVVTLKF